MPASRSQCSEAGDVCPICQAEYRDPRSLVCQVRGRTSICLWLNGFILVVVDPRFKHMMYFLFFDSVHYEHADVSRRSASLKVRKDCLSYNNNTMFITSEV